MRYLAVLVALLVGSASVIAADEDAILGRWELDKFDSYYIRFGLDNKVRIGGPGGFREGTYVMSDDGVIELITVDGGRIKKTERKYRLHGDTLELKVGVYWKKYNRAKKE